MWRLIFLLVFPITVSAQLKRFSFTENKMGSPFTIIFYHDDSLQASSAGRECFILVDSLNVIFSDYDPESEISKLSARAGMGEQKISDELFWMIHKSSVVWKKSHKTFDITLGALTQLWRKAKKENRFPSESEIKDAKRSTGFNNFSTQVFTNAITFKKPGIRFDFGGIVKGYAAQKVIDHLKKKNITMALADAGGDIALGDAPTGKDGWAIAINMPESETEYWNKKLFLKNCAVATSGDVYRYTLHEGKKYSHIIDPRTGYGVTTQRNVTVIAKDGATADWLATACSILPINKALRLVRKENAAVFIATMKNENIITYKTKRFDRFFQNNVP